MNMLAALVADRSIGMRLLPEMPFGASVRPNGSVRFRLWAPAFESVSLEIEGGAVALPRASLADGWHEIVTAQAAAGTRYRFKLPNGMGVPDPASRSQPDDVHGASEVIDPRAFAWTDAGWMPRPWAESIIYELHVGTFTTEGTFVAAIDRLDHLVALGVTVIEIMPLADFAGGRNWGYDGVYFYAPDSAYGAPDDLRRLIDAAHCRGLSVLLDVVYNHFGPEGNYISAYAPQFFTAKHKTPWGDAINYDSDGSAVVRDFVVHNALYWLREFHADGLRLDAIHSIIDDSETPLVVELAERVRVLDVRHPIPILVENEDNDAADLVRVGGAPKRYTAQWNDDVHHVLHTAATGEGTGYYADYVGDTDKLGRALAEGFAFQGEVMPFRGSARGAPSAHLPPDAFVSFVQNHDQIGNRAFGDRLAAIAPAPAVRAVTAVCLLLPQVPMIFMGEEWGTLRPFPFFCNFTGELGEAVRKGRLEEFRHDPAFAGANGVADDVPDPQAEETFRSTKLDWAEIDRPAHRAILDWYTKILAARRDEVVPLIPAMTRGGVYTVVGQLAVRVEWTTSRGVVLCLEANLKSDHQPGFGAAKGRIIWTEGSVEGPAFGPWALRCSLRAADEVTRAEREWSQFKPQKLPSQGSAQGG